MKRIRLETLLFATLASVCAQSALAADWYDAGWLYRKQVTLHHTLVQADLSNFAVLIHLPADANLAAGAKSDGTDLVFTAADGITPLDREIESYTSGTGELWVWVRVPFFSSLTDTGLYLYYGNPSGTEANSTATWNAGYAMVQHLKDATASSTVDSTSNANHGTKRGSNQPADANGFIARGQSFDGVDDLLDCGTGTSLSSTDALTLEAWVNGNGWTYKRPIALSPATPVSNYQVKVELSPSNFTYSRAKSDGGDLRFRQPDGTLLDYWIETWSYGGSSTIWVEVQGSGTSTIYLHYGNPAASAVSNGASTFLLFDDFNTLTGWTAYGTVNVSGGLLQLSSNFARVYKDCGQMPNIALRTNIRVKDDRAQYLYMGSYGLAMGSCCDGCQKYLRFVAGTQMCEPWPFVATTNVSYSYNTWYMVEETYAGNYALNLYFWPRGSSQPASPTLSYGGATHTGASSTVALVCDSGTFPTEIDWVLVRQFSSSEPVATVGSETASGIAKPGGYGLAASTSNGLGSANSQVVSAAVSAGWKHLALTYDRNAGGAEELKLYVNGTQAATGDYSTVVGTSSLPLLIGDLFTGTIDEVRLSNVVRSGEWIGTDYRIQSDPANAYALGTEEIRNLPPTAFTLVSPADLANLTDSTPTFTWNASSDPEFQTVTYRLEISTSPGFIDPLHRIVSGLTGTAHVLGIGQQLGNGTYHWRVIADDGELITTSTARQLIITAGSPDEPTLTGMEADLASGTIVTLAGRVPAGQAGQALVVYQNTGGGYAAVSGQVHWAGDNFTFVPAVPLDRESAVYVSSGGGATESRRGVLAFEYSPGVSQDNAMTHSGSGGSMKLEKNASHHFKIAVNGGSSVTVTAWVRKHGSYTGTAPKITLAGLGIAGTGGATDSLTVGANTWEQLSVSGTPNAAGVLTLTVETFSTAASAAAWIDDVSVAQ